MRRLEIFLMLMMLTAGALPAAAQSTTGDVGVEQKPGARVSLDLPFLDESGKAVTLKDIVDRPTILTLNYFRCAGLCTPLLNGVVDFLNAINLVPGKDFRVLTVSFDPRDTPDVAKRKRENLIKQLKRPFPPSAWRLLTGQPAAIEALTGAVGFRYKPDGKEFMHAGVVIVLTPDGVVSRYLFGVNFPPADVEMAVREAARGDVRPTIAKTLEFCYVYDPQSRDFVFRLTLVVGIVTVAVLAAFTLVILRRRRAPGREPR